MPKLLPLPGYIIRKCTFLSALYLMAALLFHIRADTAPFLYPALRHFIQYSQTASVLILAAGLLGGALLEDGLRHGR